MALAWARKGWTVLFIMGSASDLSAASNTERLIEEQGAKFRPLHCWFDLDPEFIDHRRYSCGELAVPEHWGKSLTRQIHLPVVTFHAKDAAPAADPVIFINGGPGGRASLRDGTAIGQLWLPFLQQQPWSAKRDLIVVSLRGTNWTDSNLDCPKLRDPLLVGGSTEPGKTDQSHTLAIGIMANCLKHLAQGHDLSGYNIDQNALDIASLRIAMGFDQWNLLGISYGTRVALTVLRDYPDGIRSVVLDSVTPVDLDPVGTIASDLVDLLERIFEACHDHENCTRFYPDSRERLENILVRAAEEDLEIKIEDHPAYGTVFLPLTPSSVIQSLLVLSLSHELMGHIPAFIDALDRGYGEDYVAWVIAWSFTFLDQFAAGTQVIQSCNDDFDDIVDAEQHAITDSELISRDLITELLGVSSFLCERFAKDPLPSDTHQAVVSDIPTLLLSGQYDAVTPPSGAIRTAETLSRSYQFTLSGMGHAPLMSSQGSYADTPGCPAKLVTAFLNNPGEQPEDPCLQHRFELEIYLPE